jgi:hypothetical protein
VRSDDRAAQSPNLCPSAGGKTNKEFAARNSVSAMAQAVQHCFCCTGPVGQPTSLDAS